MIAHAPFGAGFVGIDVALGFLLARPRLEAALVNAETHAGLREHMRRRVRSSVGHASIAKRDAGHWHRNRP